MSADRRYRPRGTPDRRKDDAERVERVSWSNARRTGRPVATFSAGADLRCPCDRILQDGKVVICGALLGTAPTATLVLAQWARTHPPTGLVLPQWCWSCTTAIEIELLTVAKAA